MIEITVILIAVFIGFMGGIISTLNYKTVWHPQYQNKPTGMTDEDMTRFIKLWDDIKADIAKINAAANPKEDK